MSENETNRIQDAYVPLHLHDHNFIVNHVINKFYKSVKMHLFYIYNLSILIRALCKTKLLPVTHVLADTWMLTVKPIYKLKNVFDDLKWTTKTSDTIYTHF